METRRAQCCCEARRASPHAAITRGYSRLSLARGVWARKGVFRGGEARARVGEGVSLQLGGVEEALAAPLDLAHVLLLAVRVHVLAQRRRVRERLAATLERAQVRGRVARHAPRAERRRVVGDPLTDGDCAAERLLLD